MIELRITENNTRGVHFFVATQSMKFKSSAEVEKKELEISMKVRELVKEEIDNCNKTIAYHRSQGCGTSMLQVVSLKKELESILEEAKK